MPLISSSIFARVGSNLPVSAPGDMTSLLMTNQHRKTVRRNLVLLVVAGFIGIYLCEAALLLFGFDTERRIRPTHPPNFRQTRRHLEYQYDFITNSFGLRSPEISRDKPKGVHRLLLAGDSFVEGIGVNGDSTISAFLERQFADGRLQVINGGLAGTGAFEQGRLVRQVGYGLDLD